MDTSKDLRARIIGGLLGKAVGGTLGAPVEGASGPLHLSYYDPVPTGILPNDDLDLQVLWLCHLATDWQGRLTRRNFAAAWRDGMHFCMDEYGVALRNLSIGLLPPYTGSYDNAFAHGLGAAIRSELWAFLAPGRPEEAMRFARRDAEVDHDGEGIHGALFWTAMDSLAFVEDSIDVLIRRSLAFLPAQCRLAQAVRDTLRWYQDGCSFTEMRGRILSSYASENFTDTVMNACFTIAALLLGEGDFGKSICLAANFGRDTDCTAATVGALLGIRNPACLPEHWLAPLGHTLVLSREITGITPPQSIEELADLVMQWQGRVNCPDEETPAPNWEEYRIAARTACTRPNWAGDFTRRPMEVDENGWRDDTLPGNLVSVDLASLPSDSLRLFELPLRISQDGEYILVVSAQCRMATWLDGELLFSQTCGSFVPAPHRHPMHQGKCIRLGVGEHLLRIAIGANSMQPERSSTPLLFTLANASDYQWVPDAFRRAALSP